MIKNRKGEDPYKIIELLENIEEPRVQRGQKHPIISILFITVVGVLCGADDWVHIEAMGKALKTWIVKFVPLPNGIPSHDTLGRVFSLIKPESFNSFLQSWATFLRERLDKEVINFDGKTLRGTAEKGLDLQGIHILNAWSMENGISLLMNCCLLNNENIPRESFLFVRHGKTDWSPSSIHQGPSDLPLNSLGKQAAEKAAATLYTIVNKECVAIISSTLKRAVQTAEIIAKKIKRPITVFPNLHERYFGDFRLLNTIEEPVEGALPPDAESEESFRERIYLSLLEVLKNRDFVGKQKIIVSHALVFKNLSLLLTGNQQSLDYGDIALFTPNESNISWTVKKITTSIRCDKEAKRILRKDINPNKSDISTNLFSSTTFLIFQILCCVMLITLIYLLFHWLSRR